MSGRHYEFNTGSAYAQRTGIYEGAALDRRSSALLIGTIAYLLPKYRTSSRTFINTHVGRRHGLLISKFKIQKVNQPQNT